jgi:hypothetical protein
VYRKVVDMSEFAIFVLVAGLALGAFGLYAATHRAA